MGVSYWYPIMCQFSIIRNAVLAGLISSAAALPSAPDPVYKAMRDSTIGDTLVVENVVLHRGLRAKAYLNKQRDFFEVPIIGEFSTLGFMGFCSTRRKLR